MVLMFGFAGILLAVVVAVVAVAAAADAAAGLVVAGLVVAVVAAAAAAAAAAVVVGLVGLVDVGPVVEPLLLPRQQVQPCCSEPSFVVRFAQAVAIVVQTVIFVEHVILRSVAGGRVRKVV
jgi:ABC-type uncharacterized transport system permease subunit